MATIHVRNSGETIQKEGEVQSFLESNGVFYTHWNTEKLPAELRNQFQLDDGDKAAILKAFAEDIQHLANTRGYRWWDVISLSESTPDLPSLLQKFEQVHTHAEDEVRAIVSGSGVFIIKGKGEVGYFDVFLKAGDVISVPEGNPHFFTLTEEKKVVAVRLFVEESGWIATPFEDPSFIRN